jgi:hypothetical protein
MIRFPFYPRPLRLETYLDERLDLAPLGQLFRSHSFCHLQRVTFDAGNDGVRKGPFLGPFIVLFDNDDLLSRLTSLEDNSNLCDMAKVRLCECSFEFTTPTFPGL